MTRRLFEAFVGAESTEVSNELPAMPTMRVSGFTAYEVEDFADELGDAVSLAPRGFAVAEDVREGPDELRSALPLSPLPATYIPDIVPIFNGTGG